MKTVNFWVMRHGEKKVNEDALSELGIEQVKKTARQFLRDLTFQAVFHSGMKRTKETVEVALEALGLSSYRPLILIEEGFGYEWAQKEQPITSQLREAIVKRKELNVANFLKLWPGALLIRGRMLGTMLGWARTLADQFPQEEKINVLVGSHSPTGELAAINPFTKALSYASLIQYVVEYDEETDIARLTASCRLPDEGDAA